MSPAAAVAVARSRPAPAAARPAPAAQAQSTARAGAMQNVATPAVALNQEVSSAVVDVASCAFIPSENVKSEIKSKGSKGLMVRVAAKDIAGEGLIKIRMDRNDKYDSMGHGSMLLLNPWLQQFGGMFLLFSVKNSSVTNGYASLKPKGGDRNDWLQAIQKNSSLLGGLGLKVENLPRPINKFENGILTLGVTNLKVEVGGFVDALFNLSIENNNKPKIDATADINIKGAAKGQLKIDNTQESLSGQVALGIDLKSFNGSAIVKYNSDGTVNVEGKAAYNANKLSGEIIFVATDLDAANNFTKSAIAAAGGKENIQSASAPSPVPLPKEGKKKRALAATGLLKFNLTQWFAGSVFVVVDAKGAVTVIGKIAPPGEIELFKQRDWEKVLVKFEARAYYGIPVVGNLNLFANISLSAIAKLGPAKIYQIEILGTYSTDPEVQKNIQISGSINISAYAGLRLRAEGGAGVEIADHDLKFGVGVNADVGVKAYAEARPTIGYRDPGEFYISGTLEMVAQPMLALGGDFFIKINTPWWSPLSDDKWIWPLFSKEWPLSDPIGINASVKDYVLGSGKVPEVEFKKPEFDPSKFMTSMVDKELPDKSGGKGSGQGTFKEDGTVQKPVVPPKKPAPKKVSGLGGKKGAKPKGGKSGVPDPKSGKELQNAKIFQAAAKLLQTLKSSSPLTHSVLNQGLAKIKAQVRGIEFDVLLKGDKWVVTPKAGGKTGKVLELTAKDTKDISKVTKDERSQEQMKADLDKAMKAAEDLSSEPGIIEAEIEQGLKLIKAKYHLVSLILVVETQNETEESIHFEGEINPGKKSGRKKIGKHSGKTLGDAIVFDWVKPVVSSYPRILIPKVSDKTVGPRDMTPVGKISIGVTYPDALKIKPNAVIKVRKPVTVNTQKDEMNRILNANGYDRDKGNEAPRDTDHIVEKQLGGPDELANLWPLDQSKNRESGGKVRAQIALIKQITGLKTLDGRYIKLKF